MFEGLFPGHRHWAGLEREVGCRWVVMVARMALGRQTCDGLSPESSGVYSIYISIFPVTPPLTHPTHSHPFIQTSTSASSDSISIYPSTHPFIHTYAPNHPSTCLPTEPLTRAPLTYYPPPLTQHSLRAYCCTHCVGETEGWGYTCFSQSHPPLSCFSFSLLEKPSPGRPVSGGA